MGFTINGVNVMSKYDTTYASENLTTISGFKINGTDIGKSASPGVDGYTTDDPDTNDAFKTANVSFNELFSTSKPLVVLSDIQSTTKSTVDDYIFREVIATSATYVAWRDMIRFTIPNIPGIQIPLRILLVGGGGGGGSSGRHDNPNCQSGAGGGGAGTFLELTMTLNETHDQYYFRGHCGQNGSGGGNGYNSARGDSGTAGSNTHFQLRNPSGAAVNEYQAEGGGGGGGNKDSWHANPANRANGVSGGGACVHEGTRNGATAGSDENGGAYIESIYISGEHPTTTVDAARAHNGGKANRYQGGAGGGGAGGAGGDGGVNGGVWVRNGQVVDRSVGFGGANGGNGYDWINGGRYAAGGGGDHRCEQQVGNDIHRYGHPGGGDRTAGAGIKNARNAVEGTGSGGGGAFDGWNNGNHGGHGGKGMISIGIPRIYTDANHHTFTPAYL